jgi:hypothetical protein
MPLRLLAVGLAAALLCACDDSAVLAEITDRVELVLSTSLCPTDEEPTERYWALANASFDIAWDTLCVRDGGEITWYAVKVSYWEDRAEDAWNVWLIHPDVGEVRYGEATIEAALDPNIVNPHHPDALERVAPATLVPGDYRVEVWGVVEDYIDSQRSEVRLTLTQD